MDRIQGVRDLLAVALHEHTPAGSMRRCQVVHFEGHLSEGDLFEFRARCRPEHDEVALDEVVHGQDDGITVLGHEADTAHLLVREEETAHLFGEDVDVGDRFHVLFLSQPMTEGPGPKVRRAPSVRPEPDPDLSPTLDRTVPAAERCSHAVVPSGVLEADRCGFRHTLLRERKLPGPSYRSRNILSWSFPRSR